MFPRRMIESPEVVILEHRAVIRVDAFIDDLDRTLLRGSSPQVIPGDTVFDRLPENLPVPHAFQTMITRVLGFMPPDSRVRRPCAPYKGWHSALRGLE